MQWRPNPRWLMVFALAVASGAAAAPTRTGLQANVMFDAMPAFARNGELLRRLQSPLGALRTRQALTSNPNALQTSPLDPSQVRHDQASFHSAPHTDPARVDRGRR